MKIVRREVVWIQTHFVTDCTYLPDHYAREIRGKVERLLERIGIVFGIHFDSKGDEGLRIVLECVPLPETMTEFEDGLAEIVQQIPSRPRRTEVQVEPPTRDVVRRR